MQDDGLTIDAVTEQYQKHGREYYGKALHEAMLQYADREVAEPLNNDSYADALFLTDIMLQKTSQSLCVLTGGCVGRFFSLLEDSLTKAVVRIRNMGGRARFVLVDTDRALPPVLDKLQRAGLPVDVTFAKSKQGSKISHYIVSDEKGLRDEKYHGDLDGKSKASDIQAEVYLNSPIHARARKVRFDAVWNQLNLKKETA